MIILGISAYYHDSAAAILVDGKLIAASCEERFSRIKHDKKFPAHAIEFCVHEAKIEYDDIDYIVFYEKPFLKFERILTTHIHHAPKGLKTFVKAMPMWLKERLNLRHTITREMDSIWSVKKKWDIRFIEHHFSHAAMAYYTSGYDNAALLVVDAVGENATTSIMKGEKKRIALIKQQNFPNSIGLLYSAFTYFLGFKVNSDEYKVMGLAPYGNLNDIQTQQFIETIKGKLVNILDNGGIIINEDYFTFMYGLKMIDYHKWEKLFGITIRKQTENISQAHMNLAAAIQSITEEILLKLAKHAKEITGCKRLCISGGCALNCAAMGGIKESNLFDDVFVPFAPGDDGGAIGAALYFYTLIGNNNIEEISPYLGTHYVDKEIENAFQRQGLSYMQVSEDTLFMKVAHYLSKGYIVGWFQGKMEFGPRALGNRSVLADPRRADMKDKINNKVKFRESFRPFAPIVLKEDASNYFNDSDSPYMMFTTQTHMENANVPAVTHIDGSARVQTITATDNEYMYSLLKAFKEQTGCSVLLNTSFNVMGEPIVCTPENAIQTFLHSGLDILVINQYIATKRVL